MSPSPNKLVVKLVLMGEYGVGKSSLFRRFVHNEFVESTDRRSTLGFDHFERTFDVDGKHVQLQLWDTGGLERIASVTSSYLKHADAALLVFGYDAFDSFNALSHHLLEVLASADTARLFLCGNKSDLRSLGMGPSDAQVHAFYRENALADDTNLFKQTFVVSCKTNDGVDEMFVDIARHMVREMPTRRPDIDQLIRLSDHAAPVKSCCS